MSRIGKQVITIPSGVEVKCAGDTLMVKGPKGTLSRSIRDEVTLTVSDGSVVVKPVAKTRLAKALWGTYASHAKT